MKTENLTLVGKHAFEVAGLGLAPFRFVGASENVITYPDGTQKAGGSCDYCGTGIRTECHVRSSDGKQFKVGCNCIEKVGDTGLLKAYKTSPEYRAKQRQIRAEKDRAISTELQRLIAERSETLRAMAHPYFYSDRKTGLPLTRLDYIQFILGCSGASGRKSLLKSLKTFFAK